MYFNAFFRSVKVPIFRIVPSNQTMVGLAVLLKDETFPDIIGIPDFQSYSKIFRIIPEK